MRKIYAETSQHTDGAYYCTARGATPGDRTENEVIVRAAGKPTGSVFNKLDDWALVIKGISRAKAEAIVMILNAPEPNE